ncbi:lysR family regulatory protein [Colletotrichum kahawae]|uniref:LysR family regulatory protein n=1 Tax=Colletotrichum kahawae TaxID=34407 RepID=A0AAD9YQV5_COLKA|nr:lysR family regulatory protein [Colletotrichum kahawae]
MFAFLTNLWRTPGPQRVPNDEVVPVGYFDDTIIFRNFVFYALFDFDSVLAPEMLHDSLRDLLSQPGWNKLGARLRRNDCGELEHHIPKAFSAERPAVGFEHVDLSHLAAGDHPTASKIPRPPSSGQPTIVGDPSHLSDLYLGPDIPRGLNDYLFTDRPQLGLRIVSFKNSTVMVLHWLHLSADAISIGSLLNAWSLKLQGREDEIPRPLTGAYALEGLGKNATKSHVLADQHMSMVSLGKWVFWNFYNLVLRPKENRVVCIPAEYLKRLKEKAMTELEAETSIDGKEQPKFVSEGDVILAWVARLSFSSLPGNSECTMALQQVYEWRRALKDLIPNDRPILSNCVGFVVTLIPAKDLLLKPLSYVASQVRRTLIEQGSREQIEAYTALIRQDPINKAPPMFGDTSMRLLMFTNWQRARLYETDFSAASVTKLDGPLFPSYIQAVPGPYEFNDGLLLFGKDSAGNYWFGGQRAQGQWGMMKRKIEEGMEEV